VIDGEFLTKTKHFKRLSDWLTDFFKKPKSIKLRLSDWIRILNENKLSVSDWLILNENHLSFKWLIDHEQKNWFSSDYLILNENNLSFKWLIDLDQKLFEF
jgi:hypothetical protein